MVLNKSESLFIFGECNYIYIYIFFFFVQIIEVWFWYLYWCSGSFSTETKPSVLNLPKALFLLLWIFFENTNLVLSYQTY